MCSCADPNGGLNVDNIALLRSSQPSVSARSLTGRENTRRRSVGDEATLAPVRARDFYCFFPPFSFASLFFPRRGSDFPAGTVQRARAGLYKYACQHNAGVTQATRRRHQAGWSVGRSSGLRSISIEIIY